MRDTSSPAVLAGLAAAALACASTAPHTAASAALNGAVALGAAAQQRSAGGCYASCGPGTVCNPRTGFCDPQPAACSGLCQSWEICVEDAVAGARCAPGPALGVRRPGPQAPPSAAGVGVSPATGTVPTLPPEKASIERP